MLLRGGAGEDPASAPFKKELDTVSKEHDHILRYVGSQVRHHLAMAKACAETGAEHALHKRAAQDGMECLEACGCPEYAQDGEDEVHKIFSGDPQVAKMDSFSGTEVRQPRSAEIPSNDLPFVGVSAERL
jgi:hypothetical protein